MNVMSMERWNVEGKIALDRRFCVSTWQMEEGRSTSEDYPHSAEDFLIPARLNHILAIQTEQLLGAEPLIVGTMFAKRYSVLVMGLLYAASVYDILLPAAPQDAHFRMTHEAEMVYRLSPAEVMNALPLEDKGARASELFAYASRLLAEHIAPVFIAVANSTGAPPAGMWSLLSINIQNLYLSLLLEEGPADARLREGLLRADLQTLLSPELARGHGAKAGPLAIRGKLFSHPAYTGHDFYVRKHCCLAYRLADEHGYCTTCPKATIAQRIDKLNKEATH